MPRMLLLIVPMIAATCAACSPAEPPLLIDGGEAPAAEVGPASSGEPLRANGENDARSAEDRLAGN